METEIFTKRSPRIRDHWVEFSVNGNSLARVRFYFAKRIDNDCQQKVEQDEQYHDVERVKVNHRDDVGQTWKFHQIYDEILDVAQQIFEQRVKGFLERGEIHRPETKNDVPDKRETSENHHENGEEVNQIWCCQT
tara:strand:+ start:32 stop:436 length:405 start_codon:yes stop_codon:yes gene_type:complete